MTDKKDTLFDAVKNGDQEHQDWLKQAIEDHFTGRPIEHPRGSGNYERAERAEQRVAELEDVPPVHEGQASYSHSHDERPVAHEHAEGQGRGGSHRTGPIWGRRPRQRTAPGM